MSAHTPDVATTAPSASRPRPIAWWLVPAAIATLLGIAAIWALRGLPTICPAIYPAPPSCSPDARLVPAITTMGLMIAGYAALVVCAVLVPRRRHALVLGLLCGAIALTFAVGAMVTLASSGFAIPL